MGLMKRLATDRMFVGGHQKVRRAALKLEEKMRRQATRRAASKAMTPVSKDAKRNVRQHQPDDGPSGRNARPEIAKSLKKKTKTTGRGVVETRITTYHPLAHLLELGTAPHGIRSRYGTMMTFLIKGKPYMALAIQHPGAKPYPYLVPALYVNNAKCRAIFIRELKHAVANFTRKAKYK